MEVKSEFEEISSCGSNALFSIQVLDDSMEEEFPKSCVILIDPSGVVKNEAYVLAENEDEGGYVFRQLVIEDDTNTLRALNSNYPDIVLPDLSCISGIIVQRAGRRRKDHKHYR